MKPIIRLFFRTLRVLLGPFMLLWERLSRPKAMARAPAQQQAVDQQCRTLVLYQFQTCPFCIKVRQEMHRLALPIERRDAQHNASHRGELVQGLALATLATTLASGADYLARFTRRAWALPARRA